jgi:hypothetical protein
LAAGVEPVDKPGGVVDCAILPNLSDAAFALSQVCTLMANLTLAWVSGWPPWLLPADTTPRSAAAAVAAQIGRGRCKKRDSSLK